VIEACRLLCLSAAWYGIVGFNVPLDTQKPKQNYKRTQNYACGGYDIDNNKSLVQVVSSGEEADRSVRARCASCLVLVSTNSVLSGNETGHMRR